MQDEPKTCFGVDLDVSHARATLEKTSNKNALTFGGEAWQRDH
jgi:hypothetical protein